MGGKPIVTLDMMNELVDKIKSESMDKKMNKAELDYKITDFNDLTVFIKDNNKNGLWQVNGASNIPNDMYNHGGLLNMSNESSRFQLYAPHMDKNNQQIGALYFRTGWNDNIKNWQKIITQDILTEELNKKLDKIGGELTGPLLSNSSASFMTLGVRNHQSDTGNGISLYSGPSNGKPSYGLMFQGTATFGTHGSVNGDWATYFTMSGANNRGWIFKHVDSNVASISSTGVFNGSDFRVGTNKVYHQGFKPTAADVGAAASSHNHDSVYSKISESWKVEGKVIPQNSDLNTLITPGVYASGSDGQSQTIINRPPETTGFSLEVKLIYNGGENLRRYMQIAIIRNSNSMYIRNRQEISGSTDGQWSKWTKVYGENNKPTAAEIGAAASSHTHSYLITADKRSENTSPTAVQAGLFPMFRSNGVDALTDGGTHHAVLHFRAYGSGTDMTGGKTHQLAFTDNSNMWFRSSTGTDSWGSWNKIYHTGNKPTAADVGAYSKAESDGKYVISSQPKITASLSITTPATTLG